MFNYLDNLNLSCYTMLSASLLLVLKSTLFFPSSSTSTSQSFPSISCHFLLSRCLQHTLLHSIPIYFHCRIDLFLVNATFPIGILFLTSLSQRPYYQKLGFTQCCFFVHVIMISLLSMQGSVVSSNWLHQFQTICTITTCLKLQLSIQSRLMLPPASVFLDTTSACVECYVWLQFSAYMSVVKEMMGKVESEHRTKLEQLDSMQQEQRSVSDG